jgi:hypothetical protein
MSVGTNLRRLIESNGYETARANLIESVITGKINPRRDIHIRDLAESLLGPAWALKLQARNAGVRLSEADEAVDPSAFADITGQLLVNEIKAKYETADFVGDELVETVPITNGNLGPQRTPWLSDVLNDASTVQPGMPYPRTQFTEQYIDYPAPEKFGELCEVLMESIYSDLTGQILDSAGSTGRRVRINKEERILDVVLGIVNNFKWNGTSFNTYYSTAPAAPANASFTWVNVKSGQVIIDWTHINELEQLFANMLDPVTGKPINVNPEWMLVMPVKYYTHKRILTATDIRTGDGASTTQATYAPSPLETNYKLLKSKFAFQRSSATASVNGGGGSAASAKEVAIYGSKKAFVWRQAEPMTTIEAPANNPAQIERDVAVQVRAREWGVAAVRDPRFVTYSYNS